MSKPWLLLVLILLFIFIALQAARPALENPPVSADLTAPPEVNKILRDACYNCHSNETKLSWFDQPIPAYWLVVRDVREARKHVNFSEIGKLPLAQQNGILFEAVNQIAFGAMPLPSYRRVHPEAAVSPEQLAVLKAYLAQVAPRPTRKEEGPFTAAGQSHAVDPAPNGIDFLPDYKNWRAVSSTDRFDNNTIRQILGNDVAVRAIAANHTNPWPDGTAFAKVAWMKRVDEEGIERPAGFVQVEFMIRDSGKYAATRNWGFARWRGTELKPYGKDASFVSECVGCHEPVRKNDYVFTRPATPVPEGRVITSWIDPKSSTMSTLYGNDQAVDYARTNADQKYPDGALLTLVTWKQMADDHWFGARIATLPGVVQTLTNGGQRAAFMP
jgi:hypothetical protein